jgi:hypothetical protein
LAEADALLAEVGQAVAPKSWEATIAQYLQGKLTDDAFLDRAKDNGARTEARTYIGFRTLIAGRIDEARQHFEWVKERGDRNYTEYWLALAALKRLKAKPVTDKGGAAVSSSARASSHPKPTTVSTQESPAAVRALQSAR